MQTLFVFFSIFGLFLINSSSGQELTTKGQKSQCEIECSGPNTVCIDFGSEVLCLSFLFISIFSITLYFVFVLVITMVCCCVKRRKRQRQRAQNREQQAQVVKEPKHSSIDLLAPKMKPSFESSQALDQHRAIPNVIVLTLGNLREQCELDSEITFDPVDEQQPDVVVVRESLENSIDNADILETRSEIYPTERHASDDRGYNTLGRDDLSKFPGAKDQRPSNSNRIMAIENDLVRINELFRHIQKRDQINNTS